MHIYTASALKPPLTNQPIKKRCLFYSCECLWASNHVDTLAEPHVSSGGVCWTSTSLTYLVRLLVPTYTHRASSSELFFLRQCIHINLIHIRSTEFLHRCFGWKSCSILRTGPDFRAGQCPNTYCKESASLVWKAWGRSNGMASLFAWS